MREMEKLLENNKAWSRAKIEKDPEIFKKGAEKQTPKYLWIGCSDSRVPPNLLLDLEPGEIFVHRNIANLFSENDLSALAFLQYGVEALKISHIIVCGHTGCGGILAAMDDKELGEISRHLLPVRKLYLREKETLDKITNPKEKERRLVELNVLEQVKNISQTAIVQKALAAGQKVSIHGWVYDISTGLLLG